MDFIELKNRYEQDKDYPDRTFEIQMYRRVLDGTLYDIIRNPFFRSFNKYGSGQEPILLSQRRPCVRYRLAKVVVDNSVSLLFGEGRFPFIDCKDENTQQMLNEIVIARHLNLVMIDCATKGSVGSVVLFIRVINGKLFFDSCCSEYFTPTFDPEDPDQLISLKEKYKLTGKKLIEMGYSDDDIEENKVYWFQREWNLMSETYYLPWCVSDEKESLKVDKKRTVFHELGFVPAIWIKNLPGGEGLDGLCTFKDGIDTNIELDYQISQCGRGLKYSSEPLLMIAGGIVNPDQQSLEPGQILNLDENGDAKHVEISGDACKAVLEYCKMLRDIILENIHGNRTTPEKKFGLQSGKAMEMMNLSLIWLTSKLRITYGDYGLVNLFKMIIKISKKSDLMVGGDIIKAGTLKDDKISLMWPQWFPATSMDRFQDAQTMKTLRESDLMSKRTAITTIADEYDIVDVEHEISEIESENKELMAQQSKIQPNQNQYNQKPQPQPQSSKKETL